MSARVPLSRKSACMVALVNKSRICATLLPIFIYSVLERDSIAVIKYYVQKQLGDKRIISAYGVKGSQDRNWRQERKQRPWRNAAYWLDPSGFLSFTAPTLFPQRAGPFYINHSSRKRSTVLCTGWPYRGILYVEVLSSQVTLACVKMTKI